MQGKKEKFVDRLLEALEDPDVRETIRTIVNEIPDAGQAQAGTAGTGDISEIRETETEEVRFDEQELLRLREENRRLESERTALHSEKEQLRSETEVLKQSMSEAENRRIRERDAWERKQYELEQAVKGFEQAYSELNHIYGSYRRLDADLHEELKRVLSAESPELFLAWGVQWDNLEALWDYLRFHVESAPEEHWTVLREIFDYLFELYGKVNGNYQRLEAVPGDSFDEELHARTADSPVCGAISQVLLQGYQGKNGRVKKSLVRI